MELYSGFPIVVSANVVGSILVGAILALFFILLIREMLTWYWKVNKIVELLQKIELNTRLQQKQPPVLPARAPLPEEQEVRPSVAQKPKTHERKIVV